METIDKNINQKQIKKLKKCIHEITKYLCIICNSKLLCIHNKSKRNCSDCNPNKFCIHKNQKHQCMECNPDCHKCIHNKSKRNCKDCNPNNFCVHDKQKHQCKLCNPNYICIHQKNKRTCILCNPKLLCIHNISKINCKECNSNRFCIHKNQKHQCMECNPDCHKCIHNVNKDSCKECSTKYCIHGRTKDYCVICGGNAYCIHNKEKYICIPCNGKGICEHKNIRKRCKLCKGSSLCSHGIQKRLCLSCDGSSYCEHKKQYPRCKICDGSALCKSSWCEKYGYKKYNGYCMTCCIHMCHEIKISRNYKTKEKHITDCIIKAFPNFSWVADKKIQDGCSRRRPDLMLDLGSHIIIVEVDENKHTAYDCSCENKRLMELSQDLGHRTIVFIRFNPDGYIDKDGKKITSCWRLNKIGVMIIMESRKKEWIERIENLKKQIQYWIDNPTEKTVEIIELYY